MKKTYIILSSLVILLLLLCTGCVQEGTSVNEDEIKRFIGSWSASENDKYNFYENGVCKYITQIGTYEIVDGKLNIILNSGIEDQFEYSFSNDDTTLTLHHTVKGYTVVYTK